MNISEINLISILIVIFLQEPQTGPKITSLKQQALLLYLSLWKRIQIKKIWERNWLKYFGEIGTHSGLSL